MAGACPALRGNNMQVMSLLDSQGNHYIPLSLATNNYDFLIAHQIGGKAYHFYQLDLNQDEVGKIIEEAEGLPASNPKNIWQKYDEPRIQARLDEAIGQYGRMEIAQDTLINCLSSAWELTKLCDDLPQIFQENQEKYEQIPASKILSWIKEQIEFAESYLFMTQNCLDLGRYWYWELLQDLEEGENLQGISYGEWISQGKKPIICKVKKNILNI